MIKTKGRKWVLAFKSNNKQASLSDLEKQIKAMVMAFNWYPQLNQKQNCLNKILEIQNIIT